MRRPRVTLRRLLLAGLALGLAAAVAIVVLLPRRTGVEGFAERAAPRAAAVVDDAAVRAAFAPGAAPYGPQAWDTLVRYLLEGWAAYRTSDDARAHYPGEPSDAGRRMDGVEGYARMLPMAATWLAAGRPGSIATPSGQIDLAAAFARGLVAGTDPSGPGYWGPVRDYSPQLVEAADVALGLWIGRDTIWAKLDAGQRARAVEWLSGALKAEPYEGNWLLFPILVHRALRGLGADVSRWDARIESRWEFFRSFHRGEGWFEDPPNGFDYYNAWSIHHALFWLQRMDPSLAGFVREVQAPFAAQFRHFFGPQGHPMHGRSVCYRMAAPVPLLTSLSTAPGAVSRGEAMRALDLTWSLFVARGALADGAVTQGFCGADPATLARYSGPASCLWSLRSLVVAYALDRELDLFEAPREPLPVERGDFSIASNVTGWTLTGTRETGRIEIATGETSGDGPPVRPYGLRERLLERLLQAPRRPDNHAALYERARYASDAPLAACPR